MNHLKDNMYVFPHIARQVMTTKQVKETLLATDNFISTRTFMESTGEKYRCWDEGSDTKTIRIMIPTSPLTDFSTEQLKLFIDVIQKAKEKAERHFLLGESDDLLLFETQLHNALNVVSKLEKVNAN